MLLGIFFTAWSAYVNVLFAVLRLSFVYSPFPSSFIILVCMLVAVIDWCSDECRCASSRNWISDSTPDRILFYCLCTFSWYPVPLTTNRNEKLNDSCSSRRSAGNPFPSRDVSSLEGVATGLMPFSPPPCISPVPLRPECKVVSLAHPPPPSTFPSSLLFRISFPFAKEHSGGKTIFQTKWDSVEIFPDVSLEKVSVERLRPCFAVYELKYFLGLLASGSSSDTLGDMRRKILQL